MTLDFKSLVVNEYVNDRVGIYHADCVDVLRGLPDASIHMGVWSPPFSNIFAYSASERDMGNARGDEEFYAHHEFFAKEIVRVLKPGRLIAMHCWLNPAMKERDGWIGLKDFRGDLIRAFEKVGMRFHSEVCINKDPAVQMMRTKALGLLHKQLKKDSCMSRMALADYLVVMRKQGANTEPVTHTNESFPVPVWQKWAAPIWNDIDQSETLQRTSAREEKDERHVAPIQLEVVRRAVNLWSNPGDVVLDPFTGIGSSGYVALQEGRRFIGAELKASYFKQAVANIQRAESGDRQAALDFGT